MLKLAPTAAVRGLHARQRVALWGSRRFRTWMAGRRAGKSYAAAVWLLGGKAGQVSAYCARTLKSAKGIMIAIFAELNAKHRLGLQIRASTGTIIEPSGHVIQFYGIRDSNQADLMRGPKFRRVFVDEGGAFDDELLKYALESVLQPTLLDLRGEMVVAGTPGPIPKGYFYDMTGNPGLEDPQPGRWPVTHWTFRDNPHMPRELVLEEALEVNGWTPQHSSFRREYDAIWCEDAEALVHHYHGEQWAKPPASGMTIMALDFGVVDQTAWSIGRQGYETRPHIHVCETMGKNNLDLPEIASITRAFREKWQVNRIVADEGALGKGYGNNLRNQYRIPIDAAPKMHKRARIDDVRGRCAADTFHLCEGAKSLYDEWLSLCWNERRDDYHERASCDISDATGYMTEAFSAWEHPADTKIENVTLQEAIRLAAMNKAMRRGSSLGRI